MFIRKDSESESANAAILPSFGDYNNTKWAEIHFIISNTNLYICYSLLYLLISNIL